MNVGLVVPLLLSFMGLWGLGGLAARLGCLVSSVSVGVVGFAL